PRRPLRPGAARRGAGLVRPPRQGRRRDLPPLTRSPRRGPAAADTIEDSPQHRCGNWLREEVVHPGGETGLSIRLPGISRGPDHVQVTAALALTFPDGLDDLVAVELGQMNIEEKGIEDRGLDRGER